VLRVSQGGQGGPGGPVLLKYRIYSVLSLLFLLAAGLLLLLGLARGYPEFSAPLLMLLLALWLTWRAITRRGTKRVIAIALLVPCLVFLVIAVIWASFDWRVLGGIAVALLASNLLSSGALSWSHLPGDIHSVKKAHNPYLIINPRSGGGAADKAGLLSEAKRRKVKLHVLGPGDDLAQLARDAVAAQADCIGVAGGDGSLAVVAKVAIEHDISFVCIPAGTRNHFAMDLGLDRSDICAALDAFGPASEWNVDVGTVNGQIFLNNVSIGAYGKIVAEDEYRDKKLSTMLSRIPDLLGPDSEPSDLQFVDPDGVEYDSAVVIHVSNNSYDLGSVSVGGRASMNDAKLGIVAVVHPDSLGRPPVLRWEEEKFEVRSSVTVAAGIDGEYVQLQPPLKFEITPRALRVRVPTSVQGISPTAKNPSLSKRTLIELCDVARGRWPRTNLGLGRAVRPR